MKTIEIRQKKVSFYFTVIFLPVLVIGFTYYIFLSGSTQVTSEAKYTFVALLLYSSYKIYAEIKRRKDNRPTLIISEFSIEIFGDFKTSSHLWQDIKTWKIELEEGSHYLVLETYNIKKRISVSCLDKTPDEIEDILNQFARRLRNNSAN